MITAVYLFPFITVNNDGLSFLINSVRICFFSFNFLYFQTIICND
uniref:Uncharacterized protein n=1 Tax=Anguilla anguilla TaxID=7936 RepID=A0A0E9XZZ7_ANGAN